MIVEIFTIRKDKKTKQMLLLYIMEISKRVI